MRPHAVTRLAGAAHFEDRLLYTVGMDTHDERPEGKSRFSPRHLGVVAFAQAGAELHGSEPLSHFPRLARENMAGQPDDSALVSWRATGKTLTSAGGEQEIWVHIQAQAALHLQCQRCLEPMVQPLEVDRNFRFVRDEATAAQLDDEIEEDVLAYSKDFDLLEMVEDELLMALPVAPAHASCPVSPRMQVQSQGFDEVATETPHPFAALEALKKKP